MAENPTHHEERLTDLEIKQAFQEKRISELDETVLAQSRVIDDLQSSLKAVEEALKRMRDGSAGGPVLGAYSEDDPVPNAG